MWCFFPAPVQQPFQSCWPDKWSNIRQRFKWCFFLNGKDQILLGVAAEQNSYRNFAVLPGSQKQGTLDSMNGTSERLPREFWWDRFPRFRLPSPAWHHGEVSIETSWVSGYQSGPGRPEDREALLNNATEMSYVAIKQETMVGFQGFQGSKDQFVRKHFSWSFHGKLMLENSLKLQATHSLWTVVVGRQSFEIMRTWACLLFGWSCLLWGFAEIIQHKCEKL